MGDPYQNVKKQNSERFASESRRNWDARAILPFLCDIHFPSERTRRADSANLTYNDGLFPKRPQK